ncbi:VOC family protein [Kribbella voronezhensis]|uniref:VOC family protein n=1 Tax=Kribbella voronezhensis TaxID=2512212 RepID=UPI001417012A|nr:VOC family protein [Kribbella voronezhensis]
MGRIIHVELTAAGLDAAAEFYTKAFGWQLTPSGFVDGYLVAETGAGDGIDAAIMKREYQQQPAIVWLEVDDLDATCAAVVAAGGTADHEAQEIPGVGRLSYVRDPEGVVLGIRQPAG